MKDPSPVIRETRVPGKALTVDQTRVFATLGYVGAEVPQPVRSALATAQARIETLCAAQAGVRIIERRGPIRKDEIVLEGLSLAVGPVIASEIDTCAAVAVFLCTLGPGFEEWSMECLNNDDPLLGYVADALASELTERVADHADAMAQAEAKARGLQTTDRFSPGYCSWPVDDQRVLFSLLPPGFCGVSLSPSSMMRPLKSVSGIIGLGSGVKRRGNHCDWCEIERCCFRKKLPQSHRAAGRREQFFRVIAHAVLHH